MIIRECWEAIVISDPLFTLLIGFVLGGALGWGLGAHVTRPREETKTTYRQRGWIFKKLWEVETRKIKYRGHTIAATTEEHLVAQKVDVAAVKGIRQETEGFAHGIIGVALRKLLGG
jgi:hypothetical protein